MVLGVVLVDRVTQMIQSINLKRWAVGGAVVPGFTFIASAIVLFGGVQLFALGLIGEYIARIHVRSMGRPAYLEDQEIQPAPGNDDVP